MRKTLSLIISVLMIVSLLSVGMSAAEGTAINNAEEFKSMAADGTYYLAADITIDASYEAEFTGTLDGNGKTVTVSAPMFAQMNGTVKNLTTVGAITVSEGNVGAVAAKAIGGRFENITNKATITNTLTGGDASVGGICGLATKSVQSSFINCVNTADITGPEATAGICGESHFEGNLFENCINNGIITSKETDDGVAAGGILGYNGTAAVVVKNCLNTGDVISGHHAGGIIGDARKSATIESCTNNGNITLTNTAKGAKEVACAGGIVGYTFDGSTTVALTIDKCVNNGNITAYIEGSALGQAGGIVGYVQNCKGAVGATVKNSINNGNVIAGSQAGGIMGYVYGSKEEYGIVENCINNGDVSAAEWASEFIAYTNNNSTTVKNSIGAGKLSAIAVADKTSHLCIVGLSSADIAQYTYENIFLADGGTTELLSYANSDSNAANRIPFSFVDGKDLAGAVIDFDGNQRTVETSNVKAIIRGAIDADLIAKANAAIGAGTFEIKGGKIAFASLKVGSSLEEAPKPVDPPTTDPVTPGTDPVTPPTTEPDSPVTGDDAHLIVAALVVVAIAGTACFFTGKKARE